MSTILIVTVCCDLRLPVKRIQKRLRQRKRTENVCSE